MKLGQDVSVQGTRTVLLNGKGVDNRTDFASLSKAIDQAIAG